MSNNPFHDLAEFITAISAANGSYWDCLVSAKAPDESPEETHNRGLRLYVECDRLLEYFGETEARQVIMERVWSFLMNTSRDWQQHAPAPLTPAELIALRALGRDRAVQAFFPSPLSVEQVTTLTVTFEKIQEVIQANPGIPENLAAYVVYLCKRGVDILQGREVDLFTLREISLQVSALVPVTAEALPEESRDGFREQGMKLIATWFLNASAGAGGNLISTAVDTALGITA